MKKKIIKIVLIIVVSIFVLCGVLLYIAIDNTIPKTKVEDMPLKGWNYTLLEKTQKNRFKAITLYNRKSYSASIKSYDFIFSSQSENMTDLLIVSKCFAALKETDSVYKYLNLYVKAKTKNPVSLIYLKSEADLRGIPEFSYLKDNLNFENYITEIEIEKKKIKYNEVLKKELEDLLNTDQYVRNAHKKTNETDFDNQEKFRKIVKKNEVPGISTVGVSGVGSIFAIIQHSNIEDINKYYPAIKKLTDNGEFPRDLFAYLEDRKNMLEGLPQIYGTQFCIASPFSIITKKTKLFPVAEAKYLDIRRLEVGLEPIKNFKN